MNRFQINKRLEFLGDAVVEFITSVHLFNMFPDLEEGGLTASRAAMVQNQHLAILVRGLDNYTLYAHGSDPCHNSELTHAMANCFKSLMGAIFLDGGTTTGINSVYLSRLFFDQYKYFLQNNISQYSNLCFYFINLFPCHGAHNIGNGDLCPGPGPFHCSVVPAQPRQEPEPAHRSMIGVVVFIFYFESSFIFYFESSWRH